MASVITVALATGGFIAIAIAIRGFIASLALSDSRLSRDRSQRLAVSSRSLALSDSRYLRDRLLSATHGILRSLAANRGYLAIALKRIAVSSRSLSASRGIIAIARSQRIAASRDRTQRIAVFSRSLSVTRGFIAIALSANRGTCATALANRQILRGKWRRHLRRRQLGGDRRYGLL